MWLEESCRILKSLRASKQRVSPSMCFAKKSLDLDIAQWRPSKQGLSYSHVHALMCKQNSHTASLSARRSHKVYAFLEAARTFSNLECQASHSTTHLMQFSSVNAELSKLLNDRHSRFQLSQMTWSRITQHICKNIFGEKPCASLTQAQIIRKLVWKVSLTKFMIVRFDVFAFANDCFCLLSGNWRRHDLGEVLMELGTSLECICRNP